MKSRLGYVTVLMLLVAFASCGGPTQAPPTAPVITTASLPNGTLETPYSQTIQASGGVAPFRWTVSVGALPSKIALNPSVTNTVTLSGTPDTAVQALAFTVQVTDSANRSAVQPYTVSILLEPDTLTLSPPSLSFAPQLVGTLSAVQPETVTNTGGIPVLINGVALAGTNVADYSQNNNCGSSLAAGANCVINVSVTPGQLGPSSASITITDRTVGSPHAVALSGMGLTSGPNATLSAASLTFGGSQLVGTTSRALSVTLTNYGTTALNITSITATTDFGESDNCQGSTLISGANCTIKVTFTPTAAGNVTGTISVTDNASGSPQTVTLSGTGTTTSYTLTGYCFYAVDPAGITCTQSQDSAQCPVGQPANTTSVDSCSFGSARVDDSRVCSGGFGGRCVAQ
jgi:Putative Ig domain/Abnormal spindle-like microcephaly-assoc'd, ASPM-SPD-2-Hydin